MTSSEKDNPHNPEPPIDEWVTETEEQIKRAKRKRAEAEKEIEDAARPRDDRFRL